VPDKPLGLMSTCGRCGGSNKWTGRERFGPWTRAALGSGPKSRVRLEEYVCTQCGRRDWAETGMEEEPRQP